MGDDEAVDLRIKLASSEERVKHVNHRIEELQGDRHKVEDERKSMRSEKDQQWERLNTAERELFKAKADAEVQRGEVERLMKAKAEDEDAFRAEKTQWRSEKSFLEDSVNKEKEA